MKIEGWEVSYNRYSGRFVLVSPQGKVTTVRPSQDYMPDGVKNFLWKITESVPCKYHRGEYEGYCSECANDDLKDNQI